MELANGSEYLSPPARLVAFVRDFFPEQWLQLFFPVASLLLLLGASNFWFKIELPNIPESYLSQVAGKTGLFRWFTQAITLRVNLEQQLANTVVRFGFVASAVLWTLRVRNPLKKFVYWVMVPIGSALIGYTAYFALTASKRDVLINTLAAGIGFPAPKYSRLPSPADGLYLTAAGLVVLILALVAFRDGLIQLPLRFRGDARNKEAPEGETSRDGRDVFALLIGVLIWGALGSFFWLIAWVLGWQIQSRSLFPAFEWLPSLGCAVASAFIAVFLFRDQVSQKFRQFFQLQPVREYVLAVGLPVLVILVPRLIFKMFSDLPLSPRGSGEWSEVLPSPLPEVLVVYVIALFEELALRGYLQNMLEKHFSLKRAIFLTALLWVVMPLGFGMGQELPLGTFVFARSTYVRLFAEFGALLIYSVPLGWLYARTRSIIPVALMHGTIAMFHLGQGYEIHVNHPYLYWIELALWVLVGWYVFRRYPVRSAVVQFIQPEPA